MILCALKVTVVVYDREYCENVNNLCWPQQVGVGFSHIDSLPRQQGCTMSTFANSHYLIYVWAFG